MIKVDQYTVLNLDEYNGVYSIVEGYEKGDQFKPRWITEEYGKEKTPKVMPKRVKIGDKAKALEVARWMLQELTEKLKREDTPF